jgi:hypothetical protein
VTKSYSDKSIAVRNFRRWEREIVNATLPAPPEVRLALTSIAKQFEELMQLLGEARNWVQDPELRAKIKFAAPPAERDEAPEPPAPISKLSGGLTTDPTDPRLGHGVDEKPVPQNEVYMVLSPEERAKGFVRPLRRSYRHVGKKPKYPLLDLTPEQHAQYDHTGFGYVKYEAYPESESPLLGKYWTQKELDRLNGCGTVTTIGLALCETYARDPHFYGSTYCCGCSKHLPVGEFVWSEDGEVVGS